MSSRISGVRYAQIPQTVAGTTSLVAAVAGKKIVVLNYAVTLSAAGTLKFQSAANDITGAMDFAAQGGAVCPTTEAGWMETNPGEALGIVSTGGAARGHIAYTLSDV